VAAATFLLLLSPACRARTPEASVTFGRITFASPRLGGPLTPDDLETIRQQQRAELRVPIGSAARAVRRSAEWDLAWPLLRKRLGAARAE